MATLIHAVGRDVAPFTMSDRFRHEITYFMSLAGEEGVPALAAGEFWVRADDVRKWLDDGVFRIVSPLDSEHKTEIELSEEQEAWLQWMSDHAIQHIRLA